MLSSRLTNIARKFTTSATRQGLHGGHVGENLPFKLGSPARTTLLFIVFFSVPFAAPFLILRHQLLKQ
ncbi:hypothetical protein O3M35_010322 [Rhynocoris fuscipes]|uniref:Cytochrome c oxidase subunit 7C, mitochondrial n=1 Tax=Rhynocoris fuscipes TaxID=488301 RepID=A0AAW1D3X9_9HEMI